MALVNPILLTFILPLRKVRKDSFLYLKPDNFIAQGSNRICYEHPNDLSLCIKTPVSKRIKVRGISVVEKYCSDALNKRGVPKAHRTLSRGWVKTNKGLGLVVERVRNSDGSPAESIIEYVNKHSCTDEQLRYWFKELEDWIFKYKVPATDLNPSNLFVKKDKDKVYLTIVDGLGGDNLGKMLFYALIPRFSLWRMKLRWPREKQKFIRFLAELKRQKSIK